MDWTEQSLIQQREAWILRQARLREGRHILKASTPERVYSLRDLSPKSYLGINYTYWLLNFIRPFDCVDEKYYQLILSPILDDYENYDDLHNYSDSLKKIIEPNDEPNDYEGKFKEKDNENKAYSWSQLSFLMADLYIYLYSNFLEEDNIEKQQSITKSRQEIFRLNAPERFKLICDMYNKYISKRPFSGYFLNWFCSKLQESLTNENASSEDINTNEQDNKKNNYDFICSKFVTAQNAPEWENWKDFRNHIINDPLHITEITMFLKTQMGIHYEMEHIELLLRDAKMLFRAEHLNLIDRELAVWESLFDQINNAIDAAQFNHNSFIEKVNLDKIELQKTLTGTLKSAALKIGIKLGVGSIYYAIEKITGPLSSAIKEAVGSTEKAFKEVVGEIWSEISQKVGKEVWDVASDEIDSRVNIKKYLNSEELTKIIHETLTKHGIALPDDYKISEETVDQLMSIEGSIGLRSFLNKRLSVLRQVAIDIVDVTPDVDFQVILDYVYYQTLMGFKVGLGTYEDEEVIGKYHQSGESLQQMDAVKTKRGKAKQDHYKTTDETTDENTDKFTRLEGIQLVRKARHMFEKSFEQQFYYTLKNISINPKYSIYLSDEGFMSLRRRLELELWAGWIQTFVDKLLDELKKNTGNQSILKTVKDWIRSKILSGSSRDTKEESIDEFINYYRLSCKHEDYARKYGMKESSSTIVDMLCKIEGEGRDLFLEEQRAKLKSELGEEKKIKIKDMKDKMKENLNEYLSVKLTLEGSVKGFQIDNFNKVIERMVKLADEEKKSIYSSERHKSEIDENKDSTAYLYYRWLTEHKQGNLILNNLLNIDNLGNKEQLHRHLYENNNYFKYSPFLDFETFFTESNKPPNEQEKMKAKDRDFLLFD